jgi:aspartate racemase
MKTIGLIGGITWHSTLDYYRLINQMMNEKLGGDASAKILMSSLNFEEIKSLTIAEDWDGIASVILTEVTKLEEAGADCMLLCANTMHKIAEEIEVSLSVPLIHIAEETGKEIVNKQLSTVALLGTRYTMLLDFYKDKLSEQGIKTIIPNEEEIHYINSAIYNEMGNGIFLPERKEGFLKIINRLISEGAEGIILGCTEIPILIKQEDVSVPVFDTTAIHSAAAVEFALS